MKNTKEVRAHFDLLSSDYKQNFSDTKSGKNHHFSTRLKLVSDVLANTSGNLLDCACGTGEITGEVLKHGRFTTAVIADISREMLTFAKERISSVAMCDDLHFEQIDIFKYRPNTTLRFDAILCLGLIAHTGSLNDLLMHLKSMLTPGGRIILQSSLLNHFGVRLVRFITAKEYEQKNSYKMTYYSSEDIETTVKLSGLEISSIIRYGFSFPFGDKIFRLGNYWLEVLMRSASARYGSDAIFVLTVPKMENAS